MNVSVVIPCLDRWELTADCVDSIRTAGDELEVVIVDNGSEQRCPVPADVVLELPANRGFAAGCNLGAKVAAGEALVFLNNDTIVHDGWLAPLVNHLAHHDVGIAGSKLLYPDGTIQHAGVCIDFDNAPGQEAWNITTDWTHTAMAVDAVTGACLAVQAEVFDELGGFDEGFWNGYEDVDLCKSATAAGYRVVYEPHSVVTHLESQSGPARWEAVHQNVQRLRAKWMQRP